MKILFATSEVDGLIKTGGLADFSKALPGELASRGFDVRIMMPKYKTVGDITLEDENFIDFALNHSDWHRGKVFHSQLDGLPLRLLEHHEFFSRTGIYDDGYVAYPDNPLRFAFLCKAVIVQCLIEGWVPDIIHCNDWQTALVPFYLNVHFSGEPRLSTTRSILTIHNGAFQGKADPKWVDIVGIPKGWFEQGKVEHDGLFNFLKCGVYAADKINTVSPGYRDELLSPSSSHGLSYWYQTRENDFTGILNGCDYSEWNPQTDSRLTHHYSFRNMFGKGVCKKALQQRSGFEPDPGIPLFGMVSRLTDQKGFDYLIPAIENLLQDDMTAQFVLLGSGNPQYADRLEDLKTRFGSKFMFFNGYDKDLSHKIEAGADFFLMPSLFEPCGLNQLYSMAYGTLPIVRLTGGLKDSVAGLVPDLSNADAASGITFEPPRVPDMIDAINRAIDLFANHPQVYRKIQQNGMGKKFGWDQSADKYINLYREALRAHRRYL